MKNRIEYKPLGDDLTGSSGRRSEKGAVLLLVLILSAVALAVMTTLLYMITVGTQISGTEKRYRTVRDAAYGGWEVMRQVVAYQGSPATQSAYLATLNAAPYSFSSTITTPVAACTGTSENGMFYTGIQAKLLARTNKWSAACDSSFTIRPGTTATYDLSMLLGAVTKYNVYAKIVNTVEGNSANDPGGLRGRGVVASNAGEVQVTPVPYLYTIEVHAENSANPSERAKLSVLYQY